MATPAPTKFRIDVSIHNLLMNSPSGLPVVPTPKGMILPEPIFPQYPELVKDPGPETIPDHRDWTRSQIWRKVRGGLFHICARALCRGISIPLLRICFSTINASRLLVLLGL